MNRALCFISKMRCFKIFVTLWPCVCVYSNLCLHADLVITMFSIRQWLFL